MKAKASAFVEIPLIFFREGKSVVAYTPALDLCAHGDDLDDAKRSFDATLRIFIRELSRRGTLRIVLKECGWRERGGTWKPPQIIEQSTQKIKVPVAA